MSTDQGNTSLTNKLKGKILGRKSRGKNQQTLEHKANYITQIYNLGQEQWQITLVCSKATWQPELHSQIKGRLRWHDVNSK